MCFAVVTRNDESCYICGDNLLNRTKLFWRRRPVSNLTNAVFLISLAFTAYCYFGPRHLSLPVALLSSFTLLLLRILLEELPYKKPR